MVMKMVFHLDSHSRSVSWEQLYRCETLPTGCGKRKPISNSYYSPLVIFIHSGEFRLRTERHSQPVGIPTISSMHLSFNLIIAPSLMTCTRLFIVRERARNYKINWSFGHEKVVFVIPHSFHGLFYKSTVKCKLFIAPIPSLIQCSCCFTSFEFFWNLC